MILVVDHYDSFVYNLVQLVRGLGFESLVVRSDERPAADLAALGPRAVILSPGPGRPEDAGCMPELVALLDRSTPLLGVKLLSSRTAECPIGLERKILAGEATCLPGSSSGEWTIPGCRSS